MQSFIRSAAVAASLVVAGTLPSLAIAQAQPVSIIVVDMERVVTQSAAGKQAMTEIDTKMKALQSRAGTLQGQLKTEADAIQAGQANNSLAGPALDTRMKAFGEKQQSAQQEIGKLEADIQRSRQWVLKQISDKVGPIVSEVMKERGASLAIPRAAALQFAPAMDATTEVLTRLDKALPRVSTTPPAN
jgi:Skp family chaperone for outer membrane proteins